MAKNNNLQDFLTDVANSIRTKTGTTDQINAQDFSNQILNIPSGENTLKNLLDATQSTYCLFSGYKGTSVDNLIQFDDTENVTNMSRIFGNCTNLTTIPLLNTSKVTDMSYMVYSCTNLTTIPSLDTSNVTDMSNMFSGCNGLTSIPLLNTSNVINMYSTFSNCRNLTSIPQLNTSNVTNMSQIFYGCSNLTTIPLLNTTSVSDTSYMFYSCYNLTTVPTIDVNNVSNMDYMFRLCSNLKSILMTNIGANLDISSSTKFERSDLLVILNNLKTVTNAKTLTMGADNLAKLTEEDKLIATNKGWTLA